MSDGAISDFVTRSFRYAVQRKGEIGPKYTHCLPQNVGLFVLLLLECHREEKAVNFTALSCAPGCVTLCGVGGSRENRGVVTLANKGKASGFPV